MEHRSSSRITDIRARDRMLRNVRNAKRRDYRMDGYVNMLNKYGMPQDNSTAYDYQPEGLIPDPLLTTQYESNGLFAIIIDAPADEAMKHGFDLGIEDTDVNSLINKKLISLDFADRFSTAIKWSRLYGGSIIVMMIDDGRLLEEPVDWSNVRGIDELRVYDRSVVQPDYMSLYSDYGMLGQHNHKLSKFGTPEYFYVYSITGSFKVHESRCLVFKNGTLPEKAMTAEYRFWGIPEYLRIKDAMRETLTTHSNASKLLERSVQPIYKMKNLSQLLSTDEGENQALRRLQLIDMSRGFLNSIAIDGDGEDYSFQTFSTTGISEVIDSSCNMLSAVTRIPQTVLFGRSPAGMSATGESDLENYYNFIDKIRNSMVKHNLEMLIDLIIVSAVADNDLDEEPKYEITFEPLWSLSETEQAQVEQIKASTAQVKAATAQTYIDLGILDPSEVRNGLKEEGEYAIEDLIDEDDPDIPLSYSEAENTDLPEPMAADTAEPQQTTLTGRIAEHGAFNDYMKDPGNSQGNETNRLTKGTPSAIIKSPITQSDEGNKNSGNYGHEGVKGQVGGSAPTGKSGVSAKGANTFKVQGFKNKQALNNHWSNGRTHREEYLPDGITTAEQYEKRAIELIQMPCDENILGYKNSLGQIIRYDRQKNDFVKGSPEKGVFTMFKPEDGEDYYLERLKIEGVEDD